MVNSIETNETVTYLPINFPIKIDLCHVNSSHQFNFSTCAEPRAALREIDE